jgi:hypothetical protein
MTKRLLTSTSCAFFLCFVAAVGFLPSLGTLPAHAGASTEALPPPPLDPRLPTMTPYEISLKAFDACLIVQSRLLETTREEVHSPCSCYAKGTVAAMSKAELADFRTTGYFNDTTREKALTFLDKCKLKRPL